MATVRLNKFEYKEGRFIKENGTVVSVDTVVVGRKTRKIYVMKCSIGACPNTLRVRNDGTKYSGLCYSCAKVGPPHYTRYGRLKHDWRKIPIELTYEEYLDFTKDRECHYCGSNILWDSPNKKNSYFLDRKDNDGPYSKDNCVVCCTSCNRVRSNRFTYEEFLKIGKAIRTVYANRVGVVCHPMDIRDLEISLGFENVAITQKFNLLKSRAEVDTSTEVVKGIRRPIPLVASNMSTVIDVDFYLKLYKLGALGIMHRAMSDSQMVNIAQFLKNECPIVAMSIGVGKDQLALAQKLIKSGANVLNVDVAHGYSSQLIDFAKELKNISPQVRLILGNTTNIDMIYDVKDFCDALKIGIAQGFACETKNTAGCTERQFSALIKFKGVAQKLGIPIISDGGCREPADLVKAIGAGANSVMAGKIFAACPESAAEIESINDVPKKLYAGMASRYVQEQWHGRVKNDCPEGGIRYLDVGESVEDLLNRYAGALRSGITYSGGIDIKSFQEKVKFVRLV